ISSSASARLSPTDDALRSRAVDLDEGAVGRFAAVEGDRHHAGQLELAADDPDVAPASAARAHHGGQLVKDRREERGARVPHQGDDPVRARVEERQHVVWRLQVPARGGAYDRALGFGVANGSVRRPRRSAPPPSPPVVVDEEGEADWGPEPEPGPGTKRDVWLLVPVGLLGCAAVSVGLGGLLYAPVFLGLAVFFVAVAFFGFALVPILTLRRQARRNT